MTADAYLAGIVDAYRVRTGPGSPGFAAANTILPVLEGWAGSVLNGLSYSGSYAKGTAIRGCSDVDLFVSIKDECTASLADIYESLFRTVRDAGHPVRRQNVSIGTEINGVQVDLVPGRRHPGATGDHSLYLSKRSSWTKTNVNMHVNLIADSNRLDEIRIIKVWRQRHRLEFPSFYLELTTLAALRGQGSTSLARNVLATLRHIAANIETARVEDPANTNNLISDDLTLAEKNTLARAARAALAAQHWEDIVT